MCAFQIQWRRHGQCALNFIKVGVASVTISLSEEGVAYASVYHKGGVMGCVLSVTVKGPVCRLVLMN